jgi:hypothetical protein
MARQNWDQVSLPLRTDPFIFGENDNTIFDLSCAGTNQLFLALDLHHAETATLNRFLGHRIFYLQVTLVHHLCGLDSCGWG